MQRARPKRHQLHPAGIEDSIVAQAIGMLKCPVPDIRDPLDVGVRVHGPDGSRAKAVMVEDSERAHAHLFGIAVTIEGEMPASLEPATVLAMNLSIAPHL